MSDADAPWVWTTKEAALLTSTAPKPSPDAVTMLESTISSVYGDPEKICKKYL